MKGAKTEDETNTVIQKCEKRGAFNMVRQIPHHNGVVWPCTSVPCHDINRWDSKLHSRRDRGRDNGRDKERDSGRDKRDIYDGGNRRDNSIRL